jgi:hypothetical protein
MSFYFLYRLLKSINIKNELFIFILTVVHLLSSFFLFLSSRGPIPPHQQPVSISSRALSPPHEHPVDEPTRQRLHPAQPLTRRWLFVSMLQVKGEVTIISWADG